MVNAQQFLNLSPLRITGGYVVFGVVWILISDQIVASVVTSQSALTTLQTIKGGMFVVTSGLLIFGLTNLHHQRLTASRSRLEYAHQQLQVLHRVLRHNIRNDLTVVRGYLELTQERASSDQIREFMKTANNAVDEILGLSEKFSLVNEVDPQPEDDTYVNLVDSIYQACAQIEAEYPAVTFERSLPTHAWVMGDRTLNHAIHEVFENAVEHHDGPPETCRVCVSVETTWSEVTLYVRDNGPGIPEGELEAIREGEETPLVHSSGIGLWLIQWLCEFHGGTVEYNTSSDGGTEAILRFDLAPKPTLAEGFAKSESQTERKEG